MAEVLIRAADTLEELQACVDLQIAVWGYADGDVIPRRIFLVAQRIGGQVLGAYAGERLVGFAMALPGVRNGMAYLHSHMLAVLPEFRDAGVGRRLKLAQREEALGRGIALMEWTFDPTEAKNAYLNLEKLGAIARRYAPDFYGGSSSPLQGGLPTDRLYAEWWMGSERVRRRLAGEARAEEVVERVTVPREMRAWKEDPAMRSAAMAVQTRNREALEDAFGRGMAAIGFERDREGNGSYLLGRVEQLF